MKGKAMAPYVILPAIVAIVWLILDIRRIVAAEREQLAKGPYNMPRSRKHIRKSVPVCGGAFWVVYYDHGGRKVTAREYPAARYHAVLQSARSKGYRVI